MLKILFNEISNSTTKATIQLAGTFLSIDASCSYGDLKGFDTIESLQSYNSYIFARCPNSKVKNFRTISHSDYKFLNMNRLGTSIKMDYTDMIQLYSEADILQIDTGIITPAERDIIIRVFEGKKENFIIDADMPYEIGTFDSSKLPTQNHPRVELWDSYAIKIGEKEYQANKAGFIKAGDFATPISVKDKEYIDIEIQKYKGNFVSPLDRDIDNEDVLLESTVGLLNARRIKLVKGKASVRLYPFGYRGAFKLKLGRKWYEVWNEYSLILGE